MRNFHQTVFAAIAAGLALTPLATPVKAQSLLRDSTADIVEAVMPAVVAISIKGMVDPSGTDEARKGFNAPVIVDLVGSGVIADSSGIIVTNRHVIDNAYSIQVQLYDGTIARGQLLGKGLGGIDLAVVKIDVGRPLPTATIGDSDKVRIGDRVLAVGNPLGLSGSVTSGIVSAKGRDLRQTSVGEFIQTDAAINHGNSGGPLFNMRGEVIGINNQIYSDTSGGGSIGIGFAIPVNDARYVLEQVKQFGRPRFGYIGAHVQAIPPGMADAMDYPNDWGVIVAAVAPDSPAAAAGIKSGDILQTINGEKVRDYRKLNRVIGTSLGKSVTLDVWNGGTTRTVTADVKELTETLWASFTSSEVKSPTFSQVTDFGFALADITPELRAQYSLDPSFIGPVVTRVVDDSAAKSAGVKVGDVLVDAQGTKLKAVSDFSNRLTELRNKGRRNVVLYVGGAGGDRWVALPLQL
ncbi:MAG: serine protease Do [Methylobacteriaceae bacterium]|nr:serine protease Do [Methylobacteriaceae bacterium]